MNNLQNKKIAMLTVSDFTNDTRILKEAQSAQRAGFSVTILAHKSFETKYKENIGKIQIIRLETFLDKIFKKIERGQGFPTKQKSKKINLFSRPSMYVSLFDAYLVNRLFVKWVKKNRADLVHANDAPTLFAALKLKKMGFKVVFDSHEFFSQSVAKPYYFWQRIYIHLEKKISRLDGLFSVCKGILNEFKKRYATSKMPQEILFNAPYYQKQKYHPVLSKKLKIVYVGRNLPSRDLRVVNRALKNKKNVEFVCLGPGWPKSYPAEKLITNINQYDLGIIPYIPDCLNNFYSTPNKLFEYMMAGLGILSADLVEIKTIIKNYSNGMVYNPNDYKDLVKKIDYLLKNPKQINLFKKNSLRAAQQFSWEREEKKQLALYKKILEK